MPELPDVEGFRRLLADTAAGRLVAAVDVPRPAILRNTSAEGLRRALTGRRLARPGRHGKWLCAPVAGRPDGDVLLMHFGMDGTLIWAETGGRPGTRHDLLVIRYEGGELRYRSARRLGGVWLAHGADAARQVTGPLGPDALGLGMAGLRDRLAGRRGGIKSALMDQRVIAGLGNLTVDEILWRARLHPSLPVREVGPGELRRLHRAMRAVLAESVPAGRVPDRAGWLTGARAAAAPVCPRCGHTLERGRVAGRGTRWCPRCQPLRGAAVSRKRGEPRAR